MELWYNNVNECHDIGCFLQRAEQSKPADAAS